MKLNPPMTASLALPSSEECPKWLLHYPLTLLSLKDRISIAANEKGTASIYL